MAEMQLQRLLIEEKAVILGAWIDKVIATYPQDASHVFKRQKDQFANPVGYNVAHCLTSLYKALFEGGDFADVPAIIEHHVQIRAVQEFSPSEALAFIYSLKQTVKEFCRKKGPADLPIEEWQAFEEKVDAVAFIAFDQYMACRERIYLARINEFKTGNYIVARDGCPSARMRKNTAQKSELEKSNIHSST